MMFPFTIRKPLRRSVRHAATAALFAVLPAQADTLHARYSVTFVGLHIGEASATGMINPGGYKIDLSAKLVGLAAAVSSIRMALVSSGAIHHGALAPAAYATTAANSRETRTVRMALNGGSVKAVDIMPPFEDKEGRVPVTEAQKRNILDPMSALIMSVPSGEPLVGPAACNRTIPIYDGFVRFDVTLSYVGTRDVATKGYTGPVTVCSARYTPISGHRADSQSTKFMAENRNIEAWLAPVERPHVVVPFHVSMMTMNGTAVIDATEFSVEPTDVTATVR